jgi:hypothetical protein
VCCAGSLLAAPELLAQPGPEPAPPTQRLGPRPEAPPDASSKQPPPTTKTPPAPPATSPSPPAVQPPPPPPPPAFVSPPPVLAPPAPPAAVYTPPATQSGRSERQAEQSKRSVSPKANKKGNPGPGKKRKRTVALAGVAPGPAVDGTLFAGGLALLALALSGTLMLTLSTRVLRGAG